MIGSSGEVRVLRAAVSIADGLPVDLGDLAGALDRPVLDQLLAALAPAAGSHDHRQVTSGADGVAQPGGVLPRLLAWPLRD